jgi:CheY-like chemotaxis protein
MEAIGRMAGGIAHDFNNLLTVIGGCSECLYAGLPENSLLRENAAEIRNAAERAAALTRQLLAFARKQVRQVRVLDLNAVVNDTRSLLRRLIPEHMDIVTFLAPDLGAVRADATQMGQILINLAINARDAMPERGTLTIKTENAAIDGDDLKPGPHVRLSVSDTGCGMSPEVLSRIFEPFFTTKASKGTGLGLSTVYGIVKQSAGDISVESQVGVGTTFHIHLPCVSERPEAVVAPEMATIRGGHETVLVVEDEPAIRRLIGAVLGRSGYTVLDAADPYMALELAERHPEQIDLLLSDVVMPGMNGVVLAGRIREARPGVKVLFMSGHSDPDMEGGLQNAGAQFIQKPMSNAELAAKVRQVLDSAP